MTGRRGRRYALVNAVADIATMRVASSVPRLAAADSSGRTDANGHERRGETRTGVAVLRVRCLSIHHRHAPLRPDPAGPGDPYPSRPIASSETRRSASSVYRAESGERVSR